MTACLCVHSKKRKKGRALAAEVDPREQVEGVAAYVLERLDAALFKELMEMWRGWC